MTPLDDQLARLHRLLRRLLWMTALALVLSTLLLWRVFMR